VQAWRANSGEVNHTRSDDALDQGHQVNFGTTAEID